MNKKSILLIEDDSQLADIMSQSLVSNPYSVDLAYNAHQAQELIAKKNYDLIFLDIGLPGENGLELLKLLRTMPHYKYIPIIILTNQGDIPTMRQAKSLGSTDYLIKVNIDYSQLGTFAQKYLANV